MVYQRFVKKKLDSIEILKFQNRYCNIILIRNCVNSTIFIKLRPNFRKTKYCIRPPAHISEAFGNGNSVNRKFCTNIFDKFNKSYPNRFYTENI